MADSINPVGRPREDKNTVHFGAMLLPELIRRVRISKAQSGKTINEITANALEIYVSVGMPFNQMNERFQNNSSQETDGSPASETV